MESLIVLFSILADGVAGTFLVAKSKTCLQNLHV